MKNYVDELIDWKDVKTDNFIFKRKYSPSKWVSKKIESVPVIRITMTCGGGMGGSKWFYHVTEINDTPLSLENFAELCNTKSHFIIKTYENEEVLINTSYVVDAVKLNVLSTYFNSDNTNFPTGVYKFSVIARPGVTGKIID